MCNVFLDLSAKGREDKKLVKKSFCQFNIKNDGGLNKREAALEKRQIEKS